MKATTFISAEQFGHASGSASNTFLISRAQALRRSLWEVVRVSKSGAGGPAVAATLVVRAASRARDARVRLE